MSTQQNPTLIPGFEDIIRHIKQQEDQIKKLKEEKQEYQPKGSQIDPEGLHDYMKQQIDKLKEEVEDWKEACSGYVNTPDELEMWMSAAIHEDEEEYSKYMEPLELRDEVAKLQEQLNEESQQRLKNKECWMGVQKQYHELKEENKKLKEGIDDAVENHFAEEDDSDYEDEEEDDSDYEDEEEETLEEENKRLKNLCADPKSVEHKNSMSNMILDHISYENYLKMNEEIEEVNKKVEEENKKLKEEANAFQDAWIAKFEENKKLKEENKKLKEELLLLFNQEDY